MSKGSNARPIDIPKDQYYQNWERIFNTKTPPAEPQTPAQKDSSIPSTLEDKKCDNGALNS